MSMSRRDLSLLIPALAAPAAQPAEAEKPVLPAQTWEYAGLPVKNNGENQSRAVFDGLTHTGYPVELHITKLGPGQLSHPPHRHVNEEAMMLKTGLIDAHFGGKTVRIGAGSVIFMASNVEHNWSNPGPEPAEYFVIALGPKA